MKIVKASYEIEAIMPEDVMAHLERCGRTCYRSGGKIAPGSAEKLLRAIIARGHESVIEHASATVRFVVDRGVSHELVRHRLCAFSQESTRYVRYDGEDEGRELTFIRPSFWCCTGETKDTRLAMWEQAMKTAEHWYLELLEQGAKPEEARSVLPNSLRTVIVATANLREWRHIFRLRTSQKAHPQMREVMVPLLAEFTRRLPVLFEDIR